MTVILRPDQEKVVGYRQGYMAVPAVPGAGKTTVLAVLAANLITEGRHHPGRILVVTYTHSAVGNFRSRIGHLLAERGLPRTAGYEVRTLHALALSIVRERPEALRLSDQFELIDGPRQEQWVQQVFQNWLACHRSEWEGVLKEDLPAQRREDALRRWEQETVSFFVTMIRQFKARGVSAEAALALTAALPQHAFLRWAAEAYEQYQTGLGARGLLDYDDLIIGACRLLEQDPQLLARLRERWTYVFEDEAQDSTPLQERILLTLVGPSGNLVRVGDSNQSIMSTFTAADPRLFRAFCLRPDVAVCPLVYAGRSSPAILELANTLVDWAIHRNPEPACRDALVEQHIQPVPNGYPQPNPCPPRYTINTHQFRDAAQELATLARWADRVCQEHPEETLAVLLPTNAMTQALAAECAQLGAPCVQVRRDLHPEAYKTVAGLLTILEYLADPTSGHKLVQAMGVTLRLDHAESAAFAPWLQDCELDEWLYPSDAAGPGDHWPGPVPEMAGSAELQAWLGKLRDWLETSGRVGADHLVLILARDLGLGNEERAVAEQLALEITRLLWEEPALDLSAVVAGLRARAEAFSRAAGTFYERRGFRPEPGVIYAVTCHGAKGLEWDTCFVGAVTRDAGTYPSSLEDWIPSELWYLQEDVMNPTALAVGELEECLMGAGQADPIRRAKADVISERLRLLYVAITRARRNLVLSCYGRRERSGRVFGVQPAAAFLPLTRLVEVRRRDGSDRA